MKTKRGQIVRADKTDPDLRALLVAVSAASDLAHGAMGESGAAFLEQGAYFIEQAANKAVQRLRERAATTRQILAKPQ